MGERLSISRFIAFMRASAEALTETGVPLAVVMLERLDPEGALEFSYQFSHFCTFPQSLRLSESLPREAVCPPSALVRSLVLPSEVEQLRRGDTAKWPPKVGFALPNKSVSFSDGKMNL